MLNFNDIIQFIVRYWENYAQQINQIYRTTNYNERSIILLKNLSKFAITNNRSRQQFLDQHNAGNE